MAPGEFELIAALSRRLGACDLSVVRGVGDDAAVVDVGSQWLALTVDALVEGVHFRRDWMDPYTVGRRAAAVNLSDLAAMGAEPRWGVVSLLLPAQLHPAEPACLETELASLYDGLRAELSAAGACVVGGNISRSPGGLVIDVTLVGACEPGRALWRSGARPGDVLLVTGFLGQAAAGRWLLASGRSPGPWASVLLEAYRAPRARLAEGRAAARSGWCTAALDLSDGLASDLRRLAEASRVGVRVEAGALPISPPTREAARQAGVDALQWALAGGDDYELLLAAAPERADQLARTVEQAGGIPVHPIGVVTPREEGLTVRMPDGQCLPLPEGGWDHLRPA